MSERFLVIRGGAIGDFILTLPAMALLRNSGAQLEVMSYRRVLGLVHQRFYAEDTRCIEGAELASCFNPRSVISSELQNYFLRFDQIISYLYDPDELFASTLRRLGVRSLLSISPILHEQSPAALQLLGSLDSEKPREQFLHCQLQLSEEDHRRAKEVFPESVDVVIHPGSGSSSKNWPLNYWISVFEHLQASGLRVAFCGGEVEEEIQGRLQSLSRFPLLWNLPLEILAACLQKIRLFLGHDSGISHLASVAGTRSLLLFGPTNAKVWAPLHPHTHVLCAPQGNLLELLPEEVLQRVEELL